MSSPKISKNLRICLLHEVADCAQTVKAAEGLNVPVLISSTGEEYMYDTEWKTYFVLKEFHGETFDIMTKHKQRYLIKNVCMV